MTIESANLANLNPFFKTPWSVVRAEQESKENNFEY